MTQLRMLNMKLCPSAIEALIHIFGENNCLYALSLANNAIPDESWPIMVTAIGTRSSLRLVNLEHTLPFDLPVEYLAECRHARTQAVLDAISRNACVRRVILTANEHDEILLE
jgi:hypothetical protein